MEDGSRYCDTVSMRTQDLFGIEVNLPVNPFLFHYLVLTVLKSTKFKFAIFDFRNVIKWYAGWGESVGFGWTRQGFVQGVRDEENLVQHMSQKV